MPIHLQTSLSSRSCSCTAGLPLCLKLKKKSSCNDLSIDLSKGFIRDRTLSMYGGIVYVGVRKYFRHILMDHETFFKIFDEPQIVFLCSIFLILFFKLRGWEHKISIKLAIKEI